MSYDRSSHFLRRRFAAHAAHVCPAALLSAIAFAPAANAQQAVQQGESAIDGRRGAIEEIVTTARRREESIQDLPVSITALTPQFMREQNLANTSEIQEFVPGLQIDEGQRATNASIAIRGVPQSGIAADPTTSPSVGQYINGVFIPSGVGNTFSIVDIERIEVLRGPQGTLFGRNTTAGAINIVTARPGPDLEGEVMLRTGSHSRRDARAILNVPIADGFYSRFAFGLDQHNGYYTNLARDDDRGLSDRDIKTANASFRWLPTDRLTVDLTGRYMVQKGNNRGGDCDFQERTGFLDFHSGLDFEEACNASEDAGKFSFFSDKDTFIDVEQQSLVLEAEWESGGPVGIFDAVNIDTNVGWFGFDYEFLIDRDYSLARLDAVQTLGDDAQGGDFYNAEIIVNGVKGRLDVLVGYNYFKESAFVGSIDRCWDLFNEVDGTGESVQCQGAKAVFFDLAPTNPLPFGPAPFATNIENEVNAHGVFIHANYDPAPWLGIEAGIRWTSENRKFRNLEWNPGAGSFATPLHILSDDTVALFGQGDETWSEFTPMASVELRLPEPAGALDDGMIYFKFANGFNSGGFNTELDVETVPELQQLFAFDPETLDNFEVGSKATFLDNSLQVNLAVFRMKFDDKQVNIDVDNSDGRFGPDPNFGVVQNAAKAEIDGFELEVVVTPTRSLRLDGGLAFQDANFTDFEAFNPETGEIEDRTDTRFNQQPRWTFTGNATYSVLIEGAGTIDARIGVFHASGNDLEAVSFSQGAERTACFQDSYVKWNGRLTWRNVPDNLSVALFGKNLSDKEIIDACDINNRGGRFFTLEDSATWGLEASYRF